MCKIYEVNFQSITTVYQFTGQRYLPSEVEHLRLKFLRKCVFTENSLIKLLYNCFGASWFSFVVCFLLPCCSCMFVLSLGLSFLLPIWWIKISKNVTDNIGRTSKAVFTTTIRLRRDCNSTALRPLDDLRYDCKPTWVWAAALRPK